jgi:hypothetical protein
MAGINVKKVYTETFKAGATLATNQYHGVKFNANRQVILMAADTDVPAGIVLNDPASGEEAEVLVVGRTPIVAGETITAGQLVRVDASGHAMVFAPLTNITTYCIGQCSSGGAVGEKVEVMVNCAMPVKGDAGVGT